MKRFAIISALVALAAGLLSVQPAGAQQTANLSINDGIMFSGCRDQTFVFAFPFIQGATWQAEVKLIDPHGKTVGDQVVTDPEGSGRGSVQICNDWPVGTYHLQAHVTSENDFGYKFDNGTYSAAFSMRLPETVTYMTAARRGNRVIVQTLTWDERTDDYYRTSSAAVRIQHKVHGRWKNVKGGALTTNGQGRAKLVIRSSKRQVVRAVTLPSTTNYTGSASAQVAVKKLHRAHR